MLPEQCRAARAWLNWSQTELAAKAQVSDSTIRDFEGGHRVPHPNNLAALRRALEAAGMHFTDDPPGVSRPRAEPKPSKAHKRKR
jgi:ribosome-binding protein aMBF1 (putative translation factor)